MATSASFSRVHASEQDTLVVPYGFPTNATRRAVVWCHAVGGTGANWLDRSSTPGMYDLLHALGRHTLVIAADLGGIGTCGNQTVQDRIDEALVAAGLNGAKNDKAILLGVSMGGWAVLNYAHSKPSKVACGVGIIPGTDLDVVRNGNLPNGWTGTAPNAPANVTTINTAYGLAAASTADYPTHGTSLTSIPSGFNPPTYAVPSVPLKAWYSPSDTTMPQANTLAYWPACVAISPDSGHTDASIGAVPAGDVLAFIAPYI